MEITKFNISNEEVTKLCKNVILSESSDYYHFLKVTKFVNQEYNQLLTESGHNEYILANTRVIDKFGKKSTIKVYIHASFDPDKGYGTDVSRICFSTSSQYVDKKYEELKDLENVEFEDDFETAIAKRDEKIEESRRQETLRKLKADLNWNIKQRRSYKASKRTYTKYEMEELLDFMSDLSEEQQTYLNGVIDAINEKETPKSTTQYISELIGAKKEIFLQLEETFKESEAKVLENVIRWLKVEYKDYSFSEDRIIAEAKEYIERQKLKLFYNAGKHLNELYIESFERTRFESNVNGFEGTWNITLTDGTEKVFNTRTIIAGGYIQRMHYRYISNLK